MRFGTFVFSISSDRETDGQVIQQTLREVELAEETGMDAVWLTEHHFDGAVASADPVVFGAAVAMRTQRVKIGFAVVEMALHHPVRLAVQTALLDNLCNPRQTFTVMRCLNAALQPFRGTRFEPQLQEAPGLRTLELQSGSTALALVLAEGKQTLPPALLEGAKKASAVRLYHLARGRVEGPEIGQREALTISGPALLTRTGGSL